VLGGREHRRVHDEGNLREHEVEIAEVSLEDADLLFDLRDGLVVARVE